MSLFYVIIGGFALVLGFLFGVSTIRELGDLRGFGAWILGAFGGVVLALGLAMATGGS